MRTSVEKRCDRIIDILKEKGSVRVSSLSRRFRVSEVVIRKDLQRLQELGILERRHGGAVRVQKGYLYKDLDERMQTMGEQKGRIAEAARGLVRERQVVMLNSGSTNVHIARRLAELDELVMVTNAVRAASEMASLSQVQVILLGGEINPKYQFTYGHDTLRLLSKYHADVCFISVDGIDAEHGLTSYYHYEAEAIRQMMAQSERVVVAADSTKIGVASLEHVGDIKSVHTLITDAAAPREQVERIRDAGVDVVTV